MLTNGGDFIGLLRDLADPWMRASVDLEMVPKRPAPTRTEILAGVERYAGVYGVHNMRVTVSATDDGGLESSFSIAGDSAAMCERAGVGFGPWPSELRRVSGDLFAAVAEDGTANEYLEFLDSDRDGRARFIHIGGRALPRLQA